MKFICIDNFVRWRSSLKSSRKQFTCSSNIFFILSSFSSSIRISSFSLSIQFEYLRCPSDETVTPHNWANSSNVIHSFRLDVSSVSKKNNEEEEGEGENYLFEVMSMLKERRDENEEEGRMKTDFDQNWMICLLNLFFLLIYLFEVVLQKIDLNYPLLMLKMMMKYDVNVLFVVQMYSNLYSSIKQISQWSFQFQIFHLWCNFRKIIWCFKFQCINISMIWIN